MPRLKKPNLTLEAKNYRPVANLPYIAKLIEKAGLVQLETYFDCNDLDEKFQSAYKSNHSTETALLHIVNSLFLALDKSEIVLMAFLDLSAAFDVVDHDILLQSLKLS